MKSTITMQDLELDSNLIDNFRDTVNSNRKFNIICENMDNTNQMNAVYSAMDWISVGVEGTKNLDIELAGVGYNHKNSLSLLQYIIVIDQIHMSIKLLHGILSKINIGATKVEYPFEETSSIFNKTVKDDVYFKHLRAAFGMHPTDLRKGVDGLKSKINQKFYASWPAFDISGENDFIIQVYSDSPGYEPSEILGINLLELNEFISERYQTLVSLNKKVSEITFTLDSQYKDMPIILNNSDIFEDLKILKDENKKRIGVLNGGYEYWIRYLESAFRSSLKMNDLDIEKEIIENYNERLMNVVREIKKNLENMNKTILRIGIQARGYEFEKIAQYLIVDHEHPIGEEYFTGLIKYSSLPDSLLQEKDFEKKRYVFDAFLYSKMDVRDEIIYKDLLDDQSAYNSTGHLGFTGYVL
ncbi:hypothetical protein [Jeotgalibacillus sp. JSM ZJ347]|uniref:hypothetical protein n=1 Tax=Jeotgalibacillus sp. JSM ZJ347 TaxID=3342117 RepID=UPI0035A860A5